MVTNVWKHTYWKIKFPNQDDLFTYWRDCTGALQIITEYGKVTPEWVKFYQHLPPEFEEHFELFQKVMKKLGATNTQYVEPFEYFQKWPSVKLIEVSFDNLQEVDRIAHIIMAHLVLRRVLFAQNYLNENEEKEKGFIQRVFSDPTEFRHQLKTPFAFYSGTLPSWVLQERTVKYYRTWTGVKNGLLKRPKDDNLHFFTFFNKK